MFHKHVKHQNKIIKMKRLSLFILFSLLISVAFAESVTFTASAPAAVVVGNQFRLSYKVNANEDRLRVAPFTDFRHLAGPSTSSSSNIVVSGGNMTRQVSKTFTYILMAEKAGTFTIPAATVVVDGKEYKSNALNIKVLKEDAPQAKQAQNNTSGGISSEDVFLRTTITKRKVYQQEYLVATVKLYTVKNIGGVNNVKFPDFNGFLAYDLIKPSQINYTVENYNGRNYNTAILRQTLLYPQRSGQLEIGQASLDVSVRIPSKRSGQSHFGDFFSTYQDVRKALKTHPQKVTVSPFPAGKPAIFSGIAGTNITVKASLDKTTVKANEPVTLKITMSGNGNLKLVNTPSIEFPADFETYDAKVNNKLTNTTSGVKGSRTFEYLVIPRYSGDFKIPSYSLTYFDTQSKTYVTKRTSSFDLKVEKGEEDEASNGVTAFASKENVKFLGKDIRFINTEKTKLMPVNNFLVDNSLYRWSFVFAILLFAILFFVFKRMQKNNSNAAFVRHKKANKMAQKRMKVARSMMNEDKDEKFYEEVLNALWGYLANKLNIPASQHTRDYVKEVLMEKEIEQTHIDEVAALLDTCEFARYAPSAVTESKQTIYNRSVALISNLDDLIKK